MQSPNETNESNLIWAVGFILVIAVITRYQRYAGLAHNFAHLGQARALACIGHVRHLCPVHGRLVPSDCRALTGFTSSHYHSCYLV